MRAMAAEAEAARLAQAKVFCFSNLTAYVMLDTLTENGASNIALHCIGLVSMFCKLRQYLLKYLIMHYWNKNFQLKLSSSRLWLQRESTGQAGLCIWQQTQSLTAPQPSRSDQIVYCEIFYKSCVSAEVPPGLDQCLH